LAKAFMPLNSCRKKKAITLFPPGEPSSNDRCNGSLCCGDWVWPMTDAIVHCAGEIGYGPDEVDAAARVLRDFPLGALKGLSLEGGEGVTGAISSWQWATNRTCVGGKARSDVWGHTGACPWNKRGACNGNESFAGV
jgi:hypothetical protein